MTLNPGKPLGMQSKLEVVSLPCLLGTLAIQQLKWKNDDFDDDHVYVLADWWRRLKPRGMIIKVPDQCTAGTGVYVGCSVMKVDDEQVHLL